MNSAYTVLIQQMANPNGSPTISILAPMPEEFAFDVGASYNTPLYQGETRGAVAGLAAAAGLRFANQAMTAQLWAGNTETELTVNFDLHTETDPISDVRTPLVNLLKLTMPTISPATGSLASPGPALDFDAAASTLKLVPSQIASSAGSVAGAIGGALANATGLTIFGIQPKTGSLNNTNTATNDGANNSQAAPITSNPQLGTASYWKSQIKNQISIRIGRYLYFDSVVITRASLTFVSNFDAVTGWPHHVRVQVGFKPLFMLTAQDLDTLFVNPSASSTPTFNLGTTMPAVAQAGAKYLNLNSLASGVSSFL